MEKSLKSGLYIVLLIFLTSFGLVILAVYLAGVLNLSIIFYLFFATLLSSAISVTILGGLFTSLIGHLVHIRRFYRLDSLTNPLLLRLSSEAPGTYHHSILVANLASKAAKVVGADSLLCRVASYFHDIGKLKNPGFFIENQPSYKNLNNIEAQLNSPLKNAQIIISHVASGVEIANEAHLPKEVINIIAQHHGNSTCIYFYEQARSKRVPDTKKSDYKYSGPKPQSKEAAIIMLADSLEASARAKNGETDLKTLVEETFSDKINERQLSESVLSQRDLFKLKKVFVENLESILHPRIDYPK